VLRHCGWFDQHGNRIIKRVDRLPEFEHAFGVNGATVIKANSHARSDTASINGHMMVVLYVDARNGEQRPHDDGYRHAIKMEAGRRGRQTC
jgi:hypothetical protein